MLRSQPTDSPSSPMVVLPCLRGLTLRGASSRKSKKRASFFIGRDPLFWRQGGAGAPTLQPSAPSRQVCRVLLVVQDRPVGRPIRGIASASLHLPNRNASQFASMVNNI